ncbi:heteromeric transposase endonuclease subunit TnsA [Hydrogenovibrio marinus]|uniref:heteromeric transposase endonuclease subunit TnsA n=1 Tax=Hydrogenovibrio marinus TaxID=28885 RepID=UPI0004A74209|nr:heteromeric transposase endonuclease subunit TnsA [Hydrogenovibrio marinus]BBN58972.1 hypothetical protein HVMH_0566 [Hydrogenovibrio marinus]
MSSFQNIDPKDAEKLTEKRGEGIGKDYIPFFKVHELSSSGESIRIRGAKTSRIHHLLSGLEFLTFQIFDWSPNVVDIREHFPLNISETITLAESLGLNHPVSNKKLKVVTTNFLIDLEGGEKLAINVLYKKELSKKRILEKLQLEKSYWQNKGVKWFVVTEEQFSAELKENMAWIRPYADLSDHESQIVKEAQNVLFPRLQKGSSKSLMKYCGELDDSYHLKPGSHLEMLRNAVANKQLSAPLNKSFHSWKCSEIELYYPLQVPVNLNVS